jgi:PDZ domain
MNGSRIVRKVIFPIFSLVHVITWQTCKFHDDEGICIELFGLISSASSQDDNLVRPAVQRRIWKRLFFGRRSAYAKFLQEQLREHEHKQHVRLEFVRELNFALAIICGMAIFTSSESIRTQLLFFETVVFGFGAWDAIRNTDQYSTSAAGSTLYLTLALLLLALIATIGLLLQVSHDVMFLPRQGDDRSIFPRKQFDVLPNDVQVLMKESVEAVIVASPSDDSTRLRMFPGEEEAGSIVATVIKPSLDAIVGITLKKMEESCRIVVCHLSSSGLFASTPLQVGQTILAINGISMTENFTAREAIAIIKRSEGHVSITATRSILLKVTKPDPLSKYGFSFCRVSKTDHMIIQKIHSGSLLAGTAVQEGMRVLAINQRVCPASLSDAVEWVRTTEADLTLIVLPTVNQFSSPILTSQSYDAKPVTPSETLPSLFLGGEGGDASTANKAACEQQG